MSYVVVGCDRNSGHPNLRVPIPDLCQRTLELVVLDHHDGEGPYPLDRRQAAIIGLMIGNYFYEDPLDFKLEVNDE